MNIYYLYNLTPTPLWVCLNPISLLCVHGDMVWLCVPLYCSRSVSLHIVSVCLVAFLFAICIRLMFLNLRCPTTLPHRRAIRDVGYGPGWMLKFSTVAGKCVYVYLSLYVLRAFNSQKYIFKTTRRRRVVYANAHTRADKTTGGGKECFVYH